MAQAGADAGAPRSAARRRSSHTYGRPGRQRRHSPQPSIVSPVVRRPTHDGSTPSPTATTAPHHSWPRRIGYAAIRGVEDTNTILSIVMRSMHTDRYQQVVDAALPLLVTIDEDVLTGVTIPEPADPEGRRAVFAEAAAAAGNQLVEHEDRNED